MAGSPGPRDVVRGLAALAGLAALLVSPPVVLWAVGGAPLPSRWPALTGVLDAVLRSDDGTVFLMLLVVAGWLGWATFALSVVVELVAALRGRAAPRLPGMAAQQRLVAGLIATVAALGPGAQVASAEPSPAGPWEPAPPVTTDLLEHGTGAEPDGSDGLPPVAAEPADVGAYVVVAGDTMWDIADTRLGDPWRYPEIVAASVATVQPDGRRLTDPDLIVPGWTLTLPETGRPPADLPDTGGPVEGGPEPGTAGREGGRPGDGVSSWEGTGPGAGIGPGPGTGTGGWAVPVLDAGGGGTDPGGVPVAVVGWTSPESVDVHPGSGSVDPRPGGVGLESGDERSTSSSADRDGSGSIAILRTSGGVGAILATALVGVLAARRARAQRRRRPGQRLSTGAAADRAAEIELRQVADPAAVEVVAQLLRGLAGRLAEAGRGLPPLRAVRLTDRVLELYLAAPAELPAPFVSTAHGAVWTAPIRVMPDGDTEPMPGCGAEQVAGGRRVDRPLDVPAPYPSLVTLGHDSEDALVLLDLEQTGMLVVDGPPELVRSALAAIAAELATSRWADDLRVTLIGSTRLTDLDLLETGRVRHVTDVESLLEELTVRAADDRLLLATAGVSGLGAARTAHVADAAWAPEIVVVAEPLPADQWSRLETLVATAPRVAVAAVVGGAAERSLGMDGTGAGRRRGLRDPGAPYPVSGGTWTVRLSGSSDRPAATLEPLGVAVRPQLLDDDTRRHVQELLQAAAREVDGPGPSGPAGGERGPAGGERGPAGGERGPAGGQVPPGVGSLVAQDGPEPAESAAVSAPERRRPEGGGYRPRIAGHGPEASEHGSPEADHRSVPGHPSAEHSAAVPSTVQRSVADTSTVSRSAADRPVVDRTVPERTVPDRTVPDRTVPDRASPATGRAESGATRRPGPVVGGAERRDPPPSVQTSLVPPLSLVLPRLIVLGPVEVRDATELVEQTKLGQLTELAMFIALHPGCDSTAIDEAIWPGSAVTKTTRGTAISKLRRWLGTDATGASLLPRTENGYTFLPGIRSDWQDWCDLLPEGPARATTADLRAALDLVRGRPFSGRGRRRYAWADQLAQEMIASIVDACHELALRALVDHTPREALRSALLGLSVEPGAEVLWRDRLKAELALGDRATLLESIEKLRATAEELGGDLEPETERLIEQILSGRPAVATTAKGRDSPHTAGGPHGQRRIRFGA